MGVSIAIPAESAFCRPAAAVVASERQQPKQRVTKSASPNAQLQKQQREMFLPASIRREMLDFFSVEELLSLEQVDAQWYQALQESGQWTRFALRDGNDAQKNGALLRRIATAHGPDVERLELINCVLSNELIVEVGARFTNLKELVVSGCKMLSDEAFAVLVRASEQSLVEIRAVKCPLLTDDSLDVVGAHQSKSIERVDFSHCRLLSSHTICELAFSCAKLSSIGLKGCPRVSDAAVVAIATHCAANLRALFVGGSGNISDVALEALATHCSNLEALDIARSNPFGSGRGGVSDQALLDFVSKCVRVEKLVLRGQGRLSLSVLSSISAHCPNLQSLDIGGCRQIIEDPVALCVELKRMALLERLSVSFARGLSDSHISSIAAQCPQLKHFDVDGAQVAVPCA
ncbi:hypothetical protein Gpo141_00005067 [Globisporangium polare]